MEKIFCRTKKVIVILLSILMISIAIVPIAKAAYTNTMEEGKKYEYRGSILVIYGSKNDAKKGNIFKIKGMLMKGNKITAEEIDGDVIKIGNKKFIKLNKMNDATKFKLEPNGEVQPQPEPQPEPEEEYTDLIMEKVVPQPEPQPEPQPNEEVVRVTGIKLNKEKGNLYKNLNGGVYTLRATVEPSNATNKKVKWTSSNKKVVTVDQNGTITWQKVGEATITATTEDGGFKATCKVRVTELEINKTSLTLNKGDSSQLEIRYKNSSKKKDIDWTSSNTKVATVDANGKVTAKGVGETIITATPQNAKIEPLTCTVTVVKQVTGISLNKTSLNMKNVGETATLKATITPNNATNKNVIWVSSDTKVATIDSNGKVIAKGFGTATITAKTEDGGKTVKCKVKVSKHDIGETEMKILASVINAEQGDESKQGQIAVGYVIKNRMQGELTNDKLLSVLTAKGQFASVQRYKKYRNYTYTFKYNGTTYYTKKYTTQSLQVAKDVMDGVVANPIENRKYFWGTSYYNKNADGTQKNAIAIGGNTFFNW